MINKKKIILLNNWTTSISIGQDVILIEYINLIIIFIKYF